MAGLYKKNRKITGVFMSFLLFFSASAVTLAAGSAHLTWTANSDADLEGYKVYYNIDSLPGTCPSGYATGSADAGNVVSYWIDTLTPGHTYYFQITAHDASQNESGCSTSPAGATSKLVTYSSDFNVDHRVNGLDFNILHSNYSQSNCGNAADSNHDCSINGLDFNNLHGDYGKSF